MSTNDTQLAKFLGFLSSPVKAHLVDILGFRDEDGQFTSLNVEDILELTADLAAEIKLGIREDKKFADSDEERQNIESKVWNPSENFNADNYRHVLNQGDLKMTVTKSFIPGLTGGKVTLYALKEEIGAKLVPLYNRIASYVAHLTQREINPINTNLDSILGLVDNKKRLFQIFDKIYSNPARAYESALSKEVGGGHIRKLSIKLDELGLLRREEATMQMSPARRNLRGVRNNYNTHILRPTVDGKEFYDRIIQSGRAIFSMTSDQIKKFTDDPGSVWVMDNDMAYQRIVSQIMYVSQNSNREKKFAKDLRLTHGIYQGRSYEFKVVPVDLNMFKFMKYSIHNFNLIILDGFSGRADLDIISQNFQNFTIDLENKPAGVIISGPPEIAEEMLTKYENLSYGITTHVENNGTDGNIDSRTFADRLAAYLSGVKTRAIFAAIPPKRDTFRDYLTKK